MRASRRRDSGGTHVLGSLLVISTIAVACLVMALFLRYGLPAGTTLAERMAFVSAHPVAWPLAWLPWMASALGLLLFCFWLRAYAPPSPARLLGFALVAFGVAPDITAESIYAFVLPRLAEQGTAETFSHFEYIATLLTGLLANAAYCLGGLILNLLLFRNPRFPRGVALAGLPSWILGLGLSVAVFNHWMAAAVVLTASSMALSLAWMLLVTIRVFRFPQSYQWKNP